MIDIEEFRREVTSFFDAHYSLRDPDLDDERLDTIQRTPHGHDAHVELARQLQSRLADAGLSGVHIPVE